MFFLGLLSTPLPYLLLAAFYFFGFAMGMFNNSSDEESPVVVSAIVIPVEAKQKTVEKNTYFYQQNGQSEFQQNSKAITAFDTSSFFFSDTRSSTFLITNDERGDFHLSGFRFSRPPPSL